MTPEQKRQVERYREAKLTYKKIAERMDTSTSSVYRVLNPAAVAETERRRRAAKREWGQENDPRGRCYCGAETNKPSAKRCKSCYEAHRSEVYALTLDVVEAMFNEGWPLREMSEAFGHKTQAGVHPWIVQLRKDGRVGYRRNYRRTGERT